jgi:hypothetical protein
MKSARQRLPCSILRDAAAPRGVLAGSNRGPTGAPLLAGVEHRTHRGPLWKFVKLLVDGTKVFSLIPHHFHAKIPKEIWQVL